MCNNFREKYLHSSEDTRKCFRKHLAAAIKDELCPCIQNKLQDPNFECPEIPDFDKNAFQNEKVVELGISCRVMARSRMEACKSANPSKHAVTAPCMQNEYPGIYGKHCQCAKNAKAKVVSSNCAANFANEKTATCQCMEEKRMEWHKKLVQVYGIVNSATSASQCGNDISKVLGSWMSKIETAFNECMPKSSDGQQKKDLHTLIELGCGQVVNGGVKTRELIVGFRFIGLFLDALNDRVTVFCDKNCNF